MSSICGIERDELGAAHFLVPVKVSCPKTAQMMILNPIHLLALCPTFSGVTKGSRFNLEKQNSSDSEKHKEAQVHFRHLEFQEPSRTTDAK
jgi:hypothetical protein